MLHYLFGREFSATPQAFRFMEQESTSKEKVEPLMHPQALTDNLDSNSSLLGNTSFQSTRTTTRFNTLPLIT
jgi:hypothetical protein